MMLPHPYGMEEVGEIRKYTKKLVKKVTGKSVPKAALKNIGTLNAFLRKHESSLRKVKPEIRNIVGIRDGRLVFSWSMAKEPRESIRELWRAFGLRKIKSAIEEIEKDIKGLRRV